MEKLFHALIIAFLAALCFIMVYPFWNSIVIAFNDGRDTMKGGVTFWPRVFTLENVAHVLRDPRIIGAFFISASRTLVGTAFGIVVTSLMAYGLSKKQLKFRKLYMALAVASMYFSGGLVPTYLVIKYLGLRDNFLVYIIPNALNVWNMIIFRSFFVNTPVSLEESAEIEGAGRFRIFFRIIVPISMPVFASLALFTAVVQWNSWFDATLYVSNANLMPIQNLLIIMLNSNSLREMAARLGGTAAEALMRNQKVTSRALVMSTMIVATLPILVVYPFVQRYFVSGVMIGSLKE